MVKIALAGDTMLGRLCADAASTGDAAGLLAELGVDVVTLANNHALDYGPRALLDAFEHLAAAGISVVGAGTDRTAARAPLRLELAGSSVTIVGVADHPAADDAAVNRPGSPLPSWIVRFPGGSPCW